MLIDKDLHRARALLVEGNALLRSVTATQLRDVGVGHVSTAPRLRDARLLLEREPFDIVVCSRDFEDSEESGQDLLDELRRERMLSPSTVFLMVVEQATYHQVVEAAEAALDAILVRPYNAVALAQRLNEARLRKRELADILRALDEGETEVALVRAIKRFSDKAPYWVYCGRLAAELMLTLKRPDDAATLFGKLAAAKLASRGDTTKGVGWARLGIARARFTAGEVGPAKRLVQELLADEPDLADAHDLLGRILVEQCEFDLALEQYLAATRLTPGCLLRQQHTGALAFYQGQTALALTHLERATSLGFKSNLFDSLTLLLTALLRHDERDGPAVATARDLLRRLHQRYPGSPRIERFVACVGALHKSLLESPAAAGPALAGLAAQVLDDDFDLEAAAMLLALAQRLVAAFENPLDYERLVQRIGGRFAVSKAMTEVLVAASGRSHPASGILQTCHAEITTHAEHAMEHALRGAAEAAARSLLTRGEATRNVRLLELARSLLRRHAALIPDAPTLAERAADLVRRCGHAVNHIAGIQRSGRAPGAMHLRGVAAERPAAAAPAAPVRLIAPAEAAPTPPAFTASAES